MTSRGNSMKKEQILSLSYSINKQNNYIMSASVLTSIELRLGLIQNL
jgi:hypothetical protein